MNSVNVPSQPVPEVTAVDPSQLEELLPVSGSYLVDLVHMTELQAYVDIVEILGRAERSNLHFPLMEAELSRLCSDPEIWHVLVSEAGYSGNYLTRSLVAVVPALLLSTVGDFKIGNRLEAELIRIYNVAIDYMSPLARLLSAWIYEFFTNVGSIVAIVESLFHCRDKWVCPPTTMKTPDDDDSLAFNPVWRVGVIESYRKGVQDVEFVLSVVDGFSPVLFKGLPDWTLLVDLLRAYTIIDGPKTEFAVWAKPKVRHVGAVIKIVDLPYPCGVKLVDYPVNRLEPVVTDLKPEVIEMIRVLALRDLILAAKNDELPISCYPSLNKGEGKLLRRVLWAKAPCPVNPFRWVDVAAAFSFFVDDDNIAKSYVMGRVCLTSTRVVDGAKKYVSRATDVITVRMYAVPSTVDYDVDCLAFGEQLHLVPESSGLILEAGYQFPPNEIDNLASVLVDSGQPVCQKVLLHLRDVEAVDDSYFLIWRISACHDSFVIAESLLDVNVILAGCCIPHCDNGFYVNCPAFPERMERPDGGWIDCHGYDVVNWNILLAGFHDEFYIKRDKGSVPQGSSWVLSTSAMISGDPVAAVRGALLSLCGSWDTVKIPSPFATNILQFVCKARLDDFVPGESVVVKQSGPDVFLALVSDKRKS